MIKIFTEAAMERDENSAPQPSFASMDLEAVLAVIKRHRPEQGIRGVDIDLEPTSVSLFWGGDGALTYMVEGATGEYHIGEFTVQLSQPDEDGVDDPIYPYDEEYFGESWIHLSQQGVTLRVENLVAGYDLEFAEVPYSALGL